MVKVKRSISVKMILTESFRNQWVSEYQDSIAHLERELEQLQFQSKKMLQEANKQGAEAYRLVSERLMKEEKIRKEKLKHNSDTLMQLKLIPDGSEIEHSQIEGEVEVRVGDNWDKLMGKTEIVVKDGVVIEIRNEGESNE